MKLPRDTARLDNLAFIGLVGGLALCLSCFFVTELRPLAIPALTLTLASLVYGMR